MSLETTNIKQQLEILYQEVLRIERSGGGGGGTSDAYTKAETDALLATKADVSTTYTKTQTDNAISSSVGTAIADLDVSSTSVSGHYIKSIAQENGLIVPVAELAATSTIQGSDKLITSGAVYTAISNAVADLDASSVGGSEKYISTIYEENGIIHATEETIDTVPTSGNVKAISSDAVFNALYKNISISSSSQNPADLDNYKVPGNYSVSSASTAATVVNTPFTQAGYVLEIIPSYQTLSGTTGVIQKATTYTSNATSIKIRWYLYVSGTGWAWTQWETIH